MKTSKRMIDDSPSAPVGETLAQILDPKLKPHWWANTDVRQNHYFVSYINEVYPVEKFPLMVEPFENVKITVKPGEVAQMPHQYYRIHTRDGAPANGRALSQSEVLEQFAKQSLTYYGA